MDDRTVTLSLSQDGRAPIDGVERVDRYEILGELGRGGMGVVYAARDPQLGRKVALKLLHAPHDADRLKREARVLARLSQENVVRIFDTGVDAGRLFVVMELIEGQTLRQWLRVPGRRWPEIVRVLAAAGRGLAAAHAVGIVHRDFKPGNVLIGDDGRVCVVDFGLARAAQVDLLASDTSPMELREAPLLDSADLEAQVTETGAVVGTPAYMAPEQWRGAAIDPRADVFAFCVTAWEALYGVRPFSGDSPRQLAQRVLHGELDAPPPSADVPARLQAALRAGLRPDPAQRPASMEVVLQRLADPPARRGRGVVLAAGAVLAVTAGALLVPHATTDARRCEGVAAPMDELWSPARRTAIATAMQQAGPRYATAAWERIEPKLDAYAEAWGQARQQACEVHRPGEPDSEHALDLRMTCLEHRRVALATVLDMLQAAAPAAIEDGPSLTWRLPAIDDCGDLEALRQREDRPDEPAVREALDAARVRLARAHVLVEAGRYAEALQEAESLLVEAERLRWTPLLAEVRLLKGSALVYDGRAPQAEDLLRQAHLDAVESGRDDLALAAATVRVRALSDASGRLDEGVEALTQAEAAWRRHGEPPHEHVRLLDARGWLARRRGDYGEARRAMEEALRIERELGTDGPDLADSLANLAAAEQAVGEMESARAHMAEALEIRERTQGPAHPDVAEDLHNLGVFLALMGKFDEAEPTFERSLALKREILGRDHVLLHHTLGALGNIALERRRWPQAERYFQEAIGLVERHLGKDHPERYYHLFGLAELYVQQGAPERAREPLVRAMAAFEGTAGPEHPELAAPLALLGEIERRAGKHAEAVAHVERSLRLDAPFVQAPAETAERRLTLARSRWELGEDRAAAVALARAALADVPADAENGQAQRFRAEAERWLAEHPWPAP